VRILGVMVVGLLNIKKGIAAALIRKSQKGFLKMVVKMDGEGTRRLSIARIADAVGIPYLLAYKTPLRYKTPSHIVPPLAEGRSPDNCWHIRTPLIIPEKWATRQKYS
jgi:hypothetical protein